MIVRRVFESRMPGIENPAVPLTSTSLITALGGTPTYTGRSVTPEGALSVSTVYACVRLISETPAALPVDLFLKTARTTREWIEDHPYVELLADQPNPEHDSGEFWRTIFASVGLRGNGYAYTPYDSNGQVTALWTIPPGRVTPVRTPSGALAYRVRFGSQDLERAGDLPVDGLEVLMESEMFHVRGFTLGDEGISPIALARQGIALAQAQEEYEARFYANDARPGGAIQAPNTLSETAYGRLKANWNALHQGVGRSHMMAILEEGATWANIGMTNADAEFLASRKHQVVEIARWYGVPLHMIQEETKDTSWGTGIENMGIGFVVYSLMPYLVRAERTTRRHMLKAQDARMYMRFNVAALLRGNFSDRQSGLAIMRQWGIIDENEWRAFEDFEPVEDPKRIVPANYVPVGTAPSDVSGRSIDNALRQLVEDIVASQLAARSNGHKEGSRVPA